MEIKNFTKLELILILNKLRSYRKKLRYIRYPLYILHFLIPNNSVINFYRTIFRIIKYCLYFFMATTVISLKFFIKD